MRRVCIWQIHLSTFPEVIKYFRCNRNFDQSCVKFVYNSWLVANTLSEMCKVQTLFLCGIRSGRHYTVCLSVSYITIAARPCLGNTAVRLIASKLIVFSASAICHLWLVGCLSVLCGNNALIFEISLLDLPIEGNVCPALIHSESGIMFVLGNGKQ